MMTTVLRVFESGSTNALWVDRQPTIEAHRITHPKRNLLKLLEDLNSEMTLVSGYFKLENLAAKLLKDKRVDTDEFGGTGYGLELMTVFY